MFGESLSLKLIFRRADLVFKSLKLTMRESETEKRKPPNATSSFSFAGDQ